MKAKYLLGGSLLLMSIAIIILQGLAGGAQYFLTVAQLREKGPAIHEHNVRISGVVVGESIHYEPRTLRLEFEIVDSVDPIGAQAPLRIVYEGPKPDLLQDHAQAIIEGRLGPDGTFQADTLLLKCPTRYEEQFPEQADEG